MQDMSDGAKQGGLRDWSVWVLTGMSFSAWFSALGLPFFLPSVLSLVAFPANRHSTHHQPCWRSHCLSNSAAQPQLPAACLVPSALGWPSSVLARMGMSLWKTMPAPLQMKC